MKKSLKYLLIVVAMLSVLSLSAQNMAQQPRNDFRSTSTMLGAGSTLPQAAVDGVSTTSGQSIDAAQPSKHIRRGRPGDWEDPYKDPIGDATWPLMLLAIAYVGVRTFHKKTRVN